MATLSYKLRKRAEEQVKKVEDDFLNLNQRLRKKWRDFYRIYRLFENEQKLPGQSDVFIPKVWEIIEKKTPAVVAHSPKFILTPRQNEAIEYIPQVRDALVFWWEEDKVQERLEGWVKEGFIYGTSIGKVGWKQEWKTLEMEYENIDPETGEPVEETEEEDMLVMERPTFETRSVFDVLTDPRCETLEDSIANIDILDNQRLSLLLQDGDLYDLSRLKKDKETLMSRHDDKYTPEEKGELDDFMGVSEWRGDIDKGTFTLKEYWGYFSPDGKPEKEEEYIITTVWQDKTLIDVIRCEPNDKGFRPFVEFIDHKIQGEFYGIGEVEPLEGLQIEYNNLRNARIDFNNSVNYPEWMYNLNAGINPSTLVHRPNNMIGVELPIGTDINTVLRTVEKPIAPQSGYAEESQLNRDFQTISQTVDYTDRGGVQGFNSTATGVESRDAERSMQTNNVVRHLETAISRIGELWLRLADYFVEDEILIRRKRTPKDLERQKESTEGAVPSLEDVPDKFTKISAEVFRDIAEKATVKVEAGSTTAYSAAGKAKDAVNIGNTTAQFMELGVPVDATRVYLDILRDAFQKPNPESYVKQEAKQPGMEGPPAGEGGMLAQNTESNTNIPTGGKAPMQPSPVNTVADG